MYKLELFKPSDINRMSIQPMQSPDQTLFEGWSDEKWASLEVHECPSISGFRDDEVILCAGILPQWEGRAIVWALLADSVGRCDMMWIHRQTLWFLDTQVKNYRRIEAHVDELFTAAHKWVRMLKFESEGLMRHFDPLGRDMRLYARIS